MDKEDLIVRGKLFHSLGANAQSPMDELIGSVE